MTISSDLNKINYVPDGIVDTFAYTFRVDDASHMSVYIDDVDIPTGWSITNLGEPAGGDVIFDTPPTGTTMSLVREVPLTQETDYTPYDAFPAESHETALDKLTMIAQQFSEIFSRTMRLPLSVEGVSLDLPPPVSLGYLRFNEAADALEVATTLPSSAPQADAVTFENLDANGDVGSVAGTVSEGDHLHAGVYEPVDADILRADTTDELSVGYTTTIEVLGSDSFVPDFATQSIKSRTAGGTITFDGTGIKKGTCFVLLDPNGSDRSIAATGGAVITNSVVSITSGSIWLAFCIGDGTNLYVDIVELA